MQVTPNTLTITPAASISAPPPSVIPNLPLYTGRPSGLSRKHHFGAANPQRTQTYQVCRQCRNFLYLMNRKKFINKNRQCCLFFYKNEMVYIQHRNVKLPKTVLSPFLNFLFSHMKLHGLHFRSNINHNFLHFLITYAHIYVCMSIIIRVLKIINQACKCCTFPTLMFSYSNTVHL